jgi:hypothetical protein
MPTDVPSTAGATATPTVALLTFTSPMYGYTVTYPSGWVPRAATEAWAIGQYAEPDEPYIDRFGPKGSPLAALAGIAAQPLPEGTTAEAWTADFEQRRATEAVACAFPLDGWTDAEVAGVQGRRIHAVCSIATGSAFDGAVLEATWVIGGLGYVATGYPPSVVEILLAGFEAP